MKVTNNTGYEICVGFQRGSGAQSWSSSNLRKVFLNIGESVTVTCNDPLYIGLFYCGNLPTGASVPTGTVIGNAGGSTATRAYTDQSTKKQNVFHGDTINFDTGNFNTGSVTPNDKDMILYGRISSSFSSSTEVSITYTSTAFRPQSFNYKDGSTPVKKYLLTYEKPNEIATATPASPIDTTEKSVNLYMTISKGWFTKGDITIKAPDSTYTLNGHVQPGNDSEIYFILPQKTEGSATFKFNIEGASSVTYTLPSGIDSGNPSSPLDTSSNNVTLTLKSSTKIKNATSTVGSNTFTGVISTDQLGCSFTYPQGTNGTASFNITFEEKTRNTVYVEHNSTIDNEVYDKFYAHEVNQGSSIQEDRWSPLILFRQYSINPVPIQGGIDPGYQGINRQTILPNFADGLIYVGVPHFESGSILSYLEDIASIKGEIRNSSGIKIRDIVFTKGSGDYADAYSFDYVNSDYDNGNYIYLNVVTGTPTPTTSYKYTVEQPTFEDGVTASVSSGTYGDGQIIQLCSLTPPDGKIFSGAVNCTYIVDFGTSKKTGTIVGSVSQTGKLASLSLNLWSLEGYADCTVTLSAFTYSLVDETPTPVPTDYPEFTTMYLPTADDILAIKNAIFTTTGGIADVYQNVVSYKRYFDNIPATGVKDLKLGLYSYGRQADYTDKLIGTKEMGTVNIREFFNNADDYLNTSIRVYVPLVGLTNITTDDVMGHNIHLMYRYELSSGRAEAILYTDSFNPESIIWTGSCNFSIEYPIGDQMSTRYATMYYDILANQLGDYTPYVLIDRKKPATDIMGKAGNKVSLIKKVKECVGFTQFERIEVNTINAYERELTEIYNLLHSGIYVKGEKNVV